MTPAYSYPVVVGLVPHPSKKKEGSRDEVQEHGSVARRWAGTRTLEELHPASRLPSTFAEAHRLWAAAFRPRGEVAAAVEAFVATLPRPVLGVHWRGTDKVLGSAALEDCAHV